MSDNSSLILWILKNHQKSCPHPDRFHLEDELTDKQLNNIFKGLGLPLLYDKVLAFWDNSAFSNCKAGVLFVEDGCYFSRTNKPTYYSEYSELCYSTVLDTALRLVVEPNEIVTITGISSPDGYFLQSLLTALKDGSPKPISSAVKRSGPVKEIKELISKKDYNSCQVIIHGAAVACGSIGAVPKIPLSDSIFITPIQIGMLISLGGVFNMKLTKSAASSILGSCASAIAGRNLSQLTVGLIPGIGNAVNATTAASLTEAIGWMFVRNYALNKTAALSFGLNNATQLFEDKIKALSAEQADRFIASMERLSEQSIARSPEIAKEVFFKTLSEYSVSHHIPVEEIPLRYTTYLKEILEVVNRGSDLIHQAEELFQYLSDQECDMQRFNAVLRAYQSYFEFVQSLMNESILDYESGYQLIMNLLRSYTEILKNYIVEYAYTHNGKLPNICDSYIQTILSFAEPQFTEPLFDYIYLNNNLSKMDAKNSLLSHLLLVGNARIRIEDTRYLVSQIPEKEGYLKLQNSIEEYNTKRLQSALSAQ